MWGIELEGTYQLTGNIQLSANYVYLNPEYDEFIDGGVNVANDRSFPHAPEHTFSLLADGTCLVRRKRRNRYQR